MHTVEGESPGGIGEGWVDVGFGAPVAILVFVLGLLQGDQMEGELHLALTDFIPELIQLFLIVHIKEELLGNLHALLNNLHLRIGRLPPLHGLLHQPMYPIQIDPRLPHHIIIPNHILIPQLHRKRIRVEFLGFGWVLNLELPPPIEGASASAAPMDVGLLWVAVADVTSYVEVVAVLL